MTTKSQHRFGVEIIGGKESVIMDNNDIYQVRLFEDIYSYCKTAHLIFDDTRGLHEMLPIVANEIVRISYESDGADGALVTKIFEFNVLKVNIESSNDKNRYHIEMFCIDINYKKLHSYHFSRSFSDECKTYGQIARFILETMAEIEIGDFEDTPEILKYFYTGLKTPAQCAQWLLSRDISVATGVPGYIMYSNTKDSGSNKLNVISLETLLMKKADMEPSTELGLIYIMRSHNEYFINNIKVYKINRPDKQAMRHLIGGWSLVWDIKKKKYIKKELSYEEALAKFSCLGAKSLFDDFADDTEIDTYYRHININETEE